MIKVYIPGLHLKVTKSESLKRKLRNMKAGKVPWMILSFKHSLGKGVEKILKISRRNPHFKTCFFLSFWVIYGRYFKTLNVDYCSSKNLETDKAYIYSYFEVLSLIFME